MILYLKEKRNNMIYWLIGQPGCGKSTLAKLLQAKIEKCLYFDGDDLRKIFGNSYSPKHFTREWREEQTRALQRLITYLVDQGFNIIIATVNPYRNVREEFKNSRMDMREIYIHKTDVRERENFAVSDYEPPLENFIDINTTGHTPEESVEEIVQKDISLGILELMKKYHDYR
jgi:adenylylsulfate kinase-like enzyme